MEVAVFSSRSRSIRVTLASLFMAPLLTGCSGFFTKYEDPQQVGLKLYQEKNYTEAAGAFRTAVRKDPRDYKSQYLLAVACDADNRFQEAIEAYRSSLDIMMITYDGQADTEFRLKVLDGLAKTVAKSDTHDTQLNVLEKKAKTTQKAEDFFLLAKVFRFRGDGDMALENYQHAVLLDNKNFPILKEYGLYLQRIGQAPRASMTLSQAFRVNDKDAEVNGALRQMGVVPGPSLKEKEEMAQPAIPKGPIPPMDFQKIRSGLGLGGGSQPAAPASSIQVPRD